MTRAFVAVVLYVLVGTIFTMVGYRLVLGGPLSPAGAERSIDGLIVFLSIVINIALAFAAAAVLAVMLAQSRPFAWVLAGSVALAGLIGAGMMLWFPGLDAAFPVTMAAGGLISAVLAQRFALLRPRGPGED